jgi:DMSO/TMAO reductase YedYZ molybdopterin-dependent catalytic subunit
MKDEGQIISPDTERENRIPPGQKTVTEWPVLHEGNVPYIGLSRWTFTISGLVAEERRLSYQEFSLLNKVRVFSDIHCVTGWSKLDNIWEGPSSGIIKELTQLLPEAKFVIVHANGGFTTNLTLGDFFEPDVLFALKYNNEPLTPEHGFPVRLIVPRLYFWKSAKWVTGVEFVAEDKPGFWETRGYHNHGDPWREERYSS